MEDFLKNARKQLEDLELEKQLKDLDLGKLDLARLKDLDFRKGGQELRKQLEQLDPKKREEEASSKGFAGGMVLGVIVGAILALIFAPKPGTETREMVAASATDLKHKVEGLVQQVRSDDDMQQTAESTLGTEPAIEREIGSVNNVGRQNQSVL